MIEKVLMQVHLMIPQIIIGIIIGLASTIIHAIITNPDTKIPRMKANMTSNMILIISHILFSLFSYCFSKNDFTFAVLSELSQPE